MNLHEPRIPILFPTSLPVPHLLPLPCESTYFPAAQPCVGCGVKRRSVESVQSARSYRAHSRPLASHAMTRLRGDAGRLNGLMEGAGTLGRVAAQWLSLPHQRGQHHGPHHLAAVALVFYMRLRGAPCGLRCHAARAPQAAATGGPPATAAILFLGSGLSTPPEAALATDQLGLQSKQQQLLRQSLPLLTSPSTRPYLLQLPKQTINPCESKRPSPTFLLDSSSTALEAGGQDCDKYLTRCKSSSLVHNSYIFTDIICSMRCTSSSNASSLLTCLPQLGSTDGVDCAVKIEILGETDPSHRTSEGIKNQDRKRILGETDPSHRTSEGIKNQDRKRLKDELLFLTKGIGATCRLYHILVFSIKGGRDAAPPADALAPATQPPVLSAAMSSPALAATTMAVGTTMEELAATSTAVGMTTVELGVTSPPLLVVPRLISHRGGYM
ncbi:unnamed protein product [Miscanthus lutarioriparius]|uniref:Uncharacterized protein n=1 Tax=Miscanthus lutarioriparius TaxID=422564 RepID=A0A811Q2A0_9POAL|nr:unnamed protein product [Miscanthus lutarioriparius]